MTREINRLLIGATLIAGLLLVLSANLPGQMSWDSVFALYQVRFGIPLTFDPPFMNFVLRIADRILPGPALFVTFDVLLYFGSLLSFLRLRNHTSWLAIPIAIFVCISPLVLVTQGTVWHDVLFANLVVACFTVLAFAAQQWKHRSIRLWLLGAVALLLAAAALTRQNGILCLPVAGLAVFLIARKNESKRAARSAVLFAACALAATIGLNAAFSLGHTNASYGSGVRMLREFDIAGVTSIDPAIDLSVLDHNDASLDTMLKSQAKGFTPQHEAFVERDAPRLWSFLENSGPDLITDQWWAIVIHHPIDYLRERAEVFEWTFLTPEIEKCNPVFVGVRGKPEWIDALAIQPGVRGQDYALFRYARQFLHTPIYSHLFYALISVTLVVLLMRRGDSQDIAVAALLSSCLLVACSYFVIAISCDFRFLYALDVSSLAGLLYFALEPTWSKPSRL